MRLHHSFATVLVGLAAACASPGGSPYLAPGPLPPLGAANSGRTSAAVPAAVAAVPAPRSQRPPSDATRSDLPSGLIASGGLGRLPGALVAGVGPVHGLAVSVSLTGRAPARDEQRLISEVLGGSGGDTGATVARALEAASGGKFRLTFSSLPALVSGRQANGANDAESLRALAVSSLRSWTRQLDVRGFDNDGADGIPGSADDDGVLDFFLIAVEAERGVPSLTIRDGVPVPVPSGRRVETGPIHVLGLGAGDGDPLLAGIGLVLDAAGLEGAERFFPAGYPRMISSLARVRLGWVATGVARPSADVVSVSSGSALVIPLRDMADGAGFWLVENDGRHTFATRVVRTSGDHFTPTETKLWEPGRSMVLVLTRQLGELGERVVLQGSVAPELTWLGIQNDNANRGGGPAPAVPVRW